MGSGNQEKTGEEQDYKRFLTGLNINNTREKIV
jgi:hypothetical protein